MNLKVGQVWAVMSHDASLTDIEWKFEIIHKAVYRNQVIWIAKKLHIKPDALQVRFFNRFGDEIDDQNFGLEFYLSWRVK